MPIQYAEITIIINLEKETMMNYFYRLLGNENKTNEDDTIIILFEDETIYDVKKECANSQKFSMEMGPIGFGTCLPLYFEIKDKNNTFFSKTPTHKNGIPSMDFKPIFANNKKHVTTKKEPSVYNSIYYCNVVVSDTIDVLSLIRIKSSEEKPRFLIAYDNEYFEKEYIIYFIHYIFSIQY